VHEVVERERDRLQSSSSAASDLDRLLGRPDYTHHANTVRKRLAALSEPNTSGTAVDETALPCNND
jgi:hypothetical protein